MISPDLVQLYQFHYFFRLNFLFFYLCPDYFSIVAIMPKLLKIYMSMMSVGSLPGWDDALKIIERISGTIIGCRRQPSIYLVIMPHFILILPFLGVFLMMMPIFLWKLYRIGLFCFRMLSVGSNYSWHFLIFCNFWQYFRDWSFYCMDSISRPIWSVLRWWVISCLVVHLLVQCG
jgi:hypothetical protein